MEVTGYDRRVVRLLQRALNAFDRGAPRRRRLALDGRLGPRTRAALALYLEARGRPGAATLAKAVHALH